jgi:hypothetical protein
MGRTCPKTVRSGLPAVSDFYNKSFFRAEIPQDRPNYNFPIYGVHGWIWTQLVVFAGRFFSILPRAIPYKDFPCIALLGGGSTAEQRE